MVSAPAAEDLLKEKQRGVGGEGPGFWSRVSASVLQPTLQHLLGWRVQVHEIQLMTLAIRMPLKGSSLFIERFGGGAFLKLTM